MDDPLETKQCVPCEGGVPPLDADAVARLLPRVPGWQAEDGRKLVRRFLFDDFVAAMAFLNRVADLAEAEGHHPDFSVHYSVVDFQIWTHAIGGLSENDFILAAKITALADGAAGRVAV